MFGQELTGISESSVIIFVGVESQNFGGSFFGESVSRFPATWTKADLPFASYLFIQRLMVRRVQFSWTAARFLLLVKSLQFL